MKQEVAGRIRVLRLNVLPPYTYDEDDDASQPTEAYIHFYQERNAAEVRDAVNAYVHALEMFQATRFLDSVLDEVLQARKRLIASTPFTVDELEEPLTDARKAYMARVYKHDLQDEWFMDRLREFASNVETLLTDKGGPDSLEPSQC